MNAKPMCFMVSAMLLALLSCGNPPVELGLQATEVEQTTESSPAHDEFTLVVIHPSQGPLQELLSAHAAKAADANRRPIVEFYADWCPPCRALDASLGDERMIEALSGTYIVRLDLDEWKNNLTGTGFKVFGIPAFFELDSEGHPTGRTITGAAWGEDIPENMAPPLRDFFQANAE